MARVCSTGHSLPFLLICAVLICVQYRHQEQLNFNRCRVFIVAAAYLLETFFDGYTVKLRGEIQITRAERSVKKRFHKYAFGVNAVRGRKREVYRVSFV